MTPHRRRVLIVGATAVMLGACDAAPPAVTSIERAPLWRLGPAPRLSIGVVDGDPNYMFRRVAGILRRPDGTVFIADVEPSLSLFDSAGRFVKQVGGRGTGPGEFAMLSRPFVYRHDSIAVWDFGQRRVSVFSANGTFARTAAVLVPRVHWPPGTSPTATCCRVVSALADGSFVLEFPSVVDRAPGPPRYGMVTLARLRADGAPLDTIGTFRDYRYVYDALARSKTRKVHHTMRFEFVTFGDTVIGGNGEGQFLLRVIRGAAPDTIRLAGTPVRVTDSLHAAFAQAYRDEFARNPGLFEGRLEDAFEGEHAEFLPAYTRVTADAAGRLWLGQWRMPFSSDSAWFHIYRSSGEPLARIRMPQDTWLMHLGADHVSLVESDSLGVQYVRVYDIIRPPAR